MSQDALGQLKHLKTARARWPFPDASWVHPSIHIIVIGSLSLLNLYRGCQIHVVVIVKSVLSSLNLRHPRQIRVVILVESTSWWLLNPPHRHRNCIVVVDPHPRCRLHIIVVDPHPRRIRIMVVDPHPRRQNRIVVVESASSPSKPHCGCRIHVVVVESASWLSIRVLIVKTASWLSNPCCHR